MCSDTYGSHYQFISVGLQPLTMRTLLLLFLLTNCLNLQPKASAKPAAKAVAKAAPKAAPKVMHLVFPIMGGFPKDGPNMFGEADNLGPWPTAFHYQGPGTGGEGGGGNPDTGGGGAPPDTFHPGPHQLPSNRQRWPTFHPGPHQLPDNPSTGNTGGGGNPSTGGGGGPPDTFHPGPYQLPGEADYPSNRPPNTYHLGAHQLPSTGGGGGPSTRGGGSSIQLQQPG